MEPDQREDEQPIFNVVGEKVALGPLRRELLPLYHRWGNDFEANVGLGHLAPSTLEGTEAWYERAGRTDGGEITFAIYALAGPRPIGTTNLHLAALSYEARERSWSRALERGGPEFVYVAEGESRDVVGFASGGPERSGEAAYEGELCAIYILQPCQRRGIGRHLTLAVVERLAQAGIYSMLVWVLARNPAYRFYEALGGREVDRKQVEIGGAVLDEVAYGWTDTGVLTGAS